MTHVLIDNATVSSVQRALGKAAIREPSLLDVEHVALSRFCEALLLADSVSVPDNYKAQFTPARKALLKASGVTFLSVPEPEDVSLGEIARGLALTWKDAYNAGNQRALFDLYFTQVGAFAKFIWEHSGSAFYLVFRANGIDKESPLIEAVLASQTDDSMGKELQIVGIDGAPVPWEKLSGHVQRMMSVMGWLGHQYIWHQVFAAQHDLAYMPHPLRDFFAYDFLERVHLGATSSASFAKAFTDGLARFQGKVNDSLARLGAQRTSITLNLPGLLPVVVRECSSKDDFLTVLGQLRGDQKVIELREMLNAAQNSADQGQFTPLAKLVRDIEIVGVNLLRQRGFEDRIIKLSPPTSITGIKLEGDDSSLGMRIPSLLYKQYFVGRRYRAFIRSVMEELTIPAQLGAIKNKLNSWAWIDEDQFPKFYLKRDQMPSLFHKRFEHSTYD